MLDVVGEIVKFEDGSWKLILNIEVDALRGHDLNMHGDIGIELNGYHDLHKSDQLEWRYIGRARQVDDNTTDE